MVHILRRDEVKKATGLSTSTLYDLMAKKKFPKPVKLGDSPKTKSVGWVSSEVEKWIEARIAQRDSARGAA